ncbi:MAG: hypothetical protein AB1345_14215 [Chloroflexota bacterium]
MWSTQFEHEIRLAEEARAAGQGGKARVCARRAAGIVWGAYFQRNEIADPGPSAYDRLRHFLTLTGTPQGTREVVEHLLLRVREDFELPLDVDLIAETHRLAQALLEE